MLFFIYVVGGSWTGAQKFDKYKLKILVKAIIDEFFCSARAYTVMIEPGLQIDTFISRLVGM